MSDEEYFNYWGKAGRGEGEQHLYHLLVFHSLDVAAIGNILLKKLPKLRRQLANLSGMPEAQFVRWAQLSLALHDLGKFTDSFQSIRPDLLQELQSRQSTASGGVRHDTLGYHLWLQHLLPFFVERGMVTEKSPRMRYTPDDLALLNAWMRATTGHHGEPPKDESIILPDYLNFPADTEAIKSFVSELIPLFLHDDITFPKLDLETTKEATWWLAGFVVLCDWLGSSREPAEFSGTPRELTDYWHGAQPWATAVVERSGLTSPEVSSQFSLQDFFGSELDVEPTPLQAEAAERQIDNSAQLFILEDVTGAGKTEAAIILLHRLMKKELVQGAYFGLPTMATSNGMYRRMGKVYQKLYVAGSFPSCVLAHSAREMSDLFRDSIVATTADTSPVDYGDGTMPAGAHCSAWLADNRKKALLANIGVGTVDQAVLSVLPSRHQSLRLLGLLGKCLILDEIHNVDARQNVLICHMLKAHAATGGSAILLSATLSKAQRKEFVNSFSEGLGRTAPVLQKISAQDYPLLTQLGSTLFDEKVLATRSSVQRTVKMKFVHNEEEIYQTIQQSSARGECICWIRNTIKDARKAYQALKEKIPKNKLKLFHARYAMQDRLDIENLVLDRFGPDSTAEDRSGQVLIASPVVQESLDLDFSQLITDLCPSDLIIQRAGRFRRHIRDVSGNRLKKGQDQRSNALLHIFAPEWCDEPKADWVKQWNSGSNAIYQADHLWFTQKWIKAHKQLCMPQDARSMIESIYGDLAAETPEGLQAAANDKEGKHAAIKSVSRADALNWQDGYTRDSNWWDEDSTATRDIEEPSHTVYLARWKNGKLTPWRDEGDFRWARSAVSMIEKKIKTEAEHPEIPQSQIERLKESMPAKGKWGLLLPLVLQGSNRWKGLALNAKGEQVIFYYDEINGLMEAEEVQEL
ncbi:MAG: CRISPR-associated helicase Cas3' [Gammaproteobacteria bacterium]|nr:CRISPR-associated helicase Cas3' [Gammaproteobacteria bacterium]MCF6231361.1 CRISPR-associated helicase Cas3' [Gammaproteobacteria bacterium]